ncbi:hypothetical protein RUM44_010830 [Polyplax serrata]|uniref:Uncharacterized protein n=1 Tax=Polyplax serrata TaxID=468196 RepID=A0ABR1ANA9_POLSC
MDVSHQPCNSRSASVDMLPTILRIRLKRRAALHMGFGKGQIAKGRSTRPALTCFHAICDGVDFSGFPVMYIMDDYSTNPLMSVASEPTPGSGCRLRGGSSSSNNSATAPQNQLKGGVPGPLHQRPRPCRLCWYCCCSCSCLAVKTDEEHKDSNKSSNNENSDQNEKPP